MKYPIATIALLATLLTSACAFAQGAQTETEAENAGLRTVITAQRAAAPTLARVPLLEDAKRADVRLLRDEYARVEILRDRMPHVERLEGDARHW